MKQKLYYFIIAILVILPYAAKADNNVGDDKYYTANALYNKKLFKLASEEYRDFLIRYPEHTKASSAKFGLALSLYELHEYSKAKTIFSELAGKPNVPYQDQIHNLLGQCYLVENNPSQAEAAFRWSVNSGKEKLYLDLPGVSENSEESPQVAMGDIQSLEPLERSIAGLIEALFQQKKWDEVIKYKNELKKIVPQSKYTSRAEFLAALACYQTKKYAEAEQILNILVKKGEKLPYYEHALFLLAECQQLQGKLNQAGKNHEIIVKKIKGKFTDNSLFRLGYINFMQEKYDSAIRDFADLRSIFSNSRYYPEAGIYLGRAYFEKQNYNKAQSVFGSLLDDNKVAADAYLWLGRVFIEEKKYDKAIDVLTAGTKKFKNNQLTPKLLFELANAKMLNKDYVESGNVLAELNKKFPKAKLNRDSLKFQAYSYNRAKMYKKSIDVCNEYLKKYPNNKEAEDLAFLKAENMFFLNDTDTAIKEYNKFIPVQGKDRYTNEAIYRLAQCYSEMKEWQKALLNSEELINDNQDIKGYFYDQLYYIAGVAAYMTKNWKKSTDYLKEYLSLNASEENIDSALMKLGVSYLKMNNYADTEKVLTRLEDKYPDSKFYPYAINELGKINFLQKKYDKAEKYFNKIITYYPKTEFVKQAEYYLGWISLNKKNTLDAEKYFKSIADKYPNSDIAANSLIQLAINQLKSGNISEAEGNLNKFITVYPNNPAKEEAIYYLYYCKSQDEKNDKIDDIFEPFIKKYPYSNLIPSAVYESAWRAKRLGRNKLAEKYYKNFIEKYHGNKLYNKVMLELAELYYNEKDYDNAINLLDKLKASEIDKSIEPQVLYRLAWCLIGREQNDAAIKIFSELLEKYPKSEFVQTSACQVGEIYLKEKVFEKAYNYFRIAVDSGGSDINLKQQVLLRLGETECLTDRWKNAKETFSQFIREYTNSKYEGRGYLWLGWSQENLKDYTRAIKNYMKAISLDAGTKIAARSQFQIGECYFALGKYEQALKEFIKIELAYNFPEWTSKAMFEQSQVLESMGESLRAADVLEKLIKKFPGTNEAIAASELLDKNRSLLITK